MARSKSFDPLRLVLGLGTGLTLGWSTVQMAWVFKQIGGVDVARSLALHANEGRRGLQYSETRAGEVYTATRTIEDGIERIVYSPHVRRFETPLLMQHGMWHGAWCWESWQALLAEWGWESVAVSLPGHGASPEQRRVELCTLDYYLGFLKDEVERLPRKPVLFGHSMGGALAQWYLKYVGEDLPAVVLVAPWVAHSTLLDGGAQFLRLDALIYLHSAAAWSATPWVRSPAHAARLLISPHALITPQELYARLGPESILVCFQHNPPFWHPPDIHTAMLYVTAECDAAITLAGATRSAEHYGAEHVVVAGAGHNLMMEPSCAETAQCIHEWLLRQSIP